MGSSGYLAVEILIVNRKKYSNNNEMFEKIGQLNYKEWKEGKH